MSEKNDQHNIFQPTFGNRPLEDNVFKPILAPLSDNDRKFMKALAKCGETASIAALQSALGNGGPAIQPYRKRLIDAGVIESPRRGELVFAVPYLPEYLQGNNMR